MATAVIGCLTWAGHYRIRGLGLSQWRPVTHFGIRKTAETVMNQLGAAAPDFVIGRMLGLAQVGLFSRGSGLVRMFRQNVMGSVAILFLIPLLRGSIAKAGMSARPTCKASR